MTEAEHPLWNLIRKFNANTGWGPMEYEPLPFPWKSASRHEYETKVILDISFISVCLLEALVWKSPRLPERAYMTRHEEVFQFITTTPLGLAIGTAAQKARKSIRFIPAFSESIQFREFPLACLISMEAGRRLDGGPPRESEWREIIASHLSEKSSDPLEFSYFFQWAASLAPNELEFSEELTKSRSRSENAAVKRIRRGKAAKQSRFKDGLVSGWIVAALWCRSSSGILDIIEPGSNLASDVRSLETDISRLALTSSRHPEHEESIKEAEARFLKSLEL